MSSNFKISTASRSAACDAIVDQLDSAAGRCEIRTGAPPANCSDASSGTLLGTFTFGAPGFGDALAGTAAAEAIDDAIASGSGDAGYFRVYPNGAGDTECMFQGTAGEEADEPDMTFTEKTIVATGTLECSSFNFTIPVQ